VTAKRTTPHLVETALAGCVVSWLRGQGYDVYQEVQAGRDQAIADVVVDVDGRGWIIEVKRTLGLALLAQADRWVRGASAFWVSVAVPAGKTKVFTPSQGLARQICLEKGIGLILVGGPSDVWEKIPARLHRGARHDLLKHCVPRHRDFCPAGSARGQYWTAYRRTMEHVKHFLARHGPSTAKQIVDHVATHYASASTARACLLKRLQTIEAEKGWVTCSREGRAWLFRLTETAESVSGRSNGQ